MLWLYSILYSILYIYIYIVLSIIVRYSPGRQTLLYLTIRYLLLVFLWGVLFRSTWNSTYHICSPIAGCRFGRSYSQFPSQHFPSQYLFQGLGCPDIIFLCLFLGLYFDNSLFIILVCI